MAIQVYSKHPSRIMAVPSKVINLGTNTISSVAVSAAPAGLTVSATFSGAVVTTLVSGGTTGTTYRVTVQITISNGEVAVDLYDIQVDVNHDQ